MGVLTRHQNGAASGREEIGEGSQVRLRALNEETEWEVTIVASHEADPNADRISDQCPIGEALLGRRQGDVILVDVPLGRMEYRVVSVSRAGGSRNDWRPQAAARPRELEKETSHVG
jgi:transcription elongation GreA/GreB family factor